MFATCLEKFVLGSHNNQIRLAYLSTGSLIISCRGDGTTISLWPHRYETFVSQRVVFASDKAATFPYN